MATLEREELETVPTEAPVDIRELAESLLNLDTYDPEAVWAVRITTITDLPFESEGKYYLHDQWRKEHGQEPYSGIDVHNPPPWLHATRALQRLVSLRWESGDTRPDQALTALGGKELQALREFTTATPRVRVDVVQDGLVEVWDTSRHMTTLLPQAFELVLLSCVTHDPVPGSPHYELRRCSWERCKKQAGTGPGWMLVPPRGAHRTYCSNSCRQMAYQARRS